MTDTDVLLLNTCPRLRCVLNDDHPGAHRNHYLPDDRVLRTVPIRNRMTSRGLQPYLMLRTPCCDVTAGRQVFYVRYSREKNEPHWLRCGYQYGTRKTYPKGCGWNWYIDPADPLDLDGTSATVVLRCGRW